MRRVLVATVVLGLMLSGGAVAASKITSKDIKNDTITSADIKNGSVRLGDLSKGTRNTLKGQKGATGAKGADGLTGAAGAVGPKGDEHDTGPQGPAGTDGAWFPKGFFITNKSVGLTASGADFGPYPDGGAAGGSLLYTGMNGKKLSEITKLVYTVEYSTSNDAAIGTPYCASSSTTTTTT